MESVSPDFLPITLILIWRYRVRRSLRLSFDTVTVCLQQESLCGQSNFERSGIVPHQADGCEDSPQSDDRAKHPVLPPNGRHGAFVLGAVGEETSGAAEALAADGQLDLRRLLDVAHPLVVHVRGADVELVAI